jgi:peptidoglycan/xylan/chitin deacetylase (PgdA/CDA1 family)
VTAIRSVAELIDEAEFLDDLAAGHRRSRRGCAVLITFDDGYSNCVDDRGLAVARDLGVRPTIFVIAAAVDPTQGTPRRLLRDPSGRPHPLCSRRDLEAAIADGWSVGCHTATHWDCATGTEDDLDREIHGARTTLEATLGIEVRTFAYPFGRPGNLSDAAGSRVRSSGYRAAFTTRRGRIDVDRRPDPYLLPRNVVEPWWGVRELIGCLAGGLDHLPLWR